MVFNDKSAESREHEADGDLEKHLQQPPEDSDIDKCLFRRHCALIYRYGDQHGFAGKQRLRAHEGVDIRICSEDLKTIIEALSFRSSIANRSFVLSANETSPSSVVTDPIRRLDYARFQKLVGTLPNNIDVTGLHLAEPDLLAILLRSLPEAVRNFVLHHAGGDSYYQSFRVAAQRWEQQQRMFQEFHTKKGISQTEDGVEYYDVSGDGNYHIDAVVHQVWEQEAFHRIMPGRSFEAQVFSLPRVWGHWAQLSKESRRERKGQKGLRERCSKERPF